MQSETQNDIFSGLDKIVNGEVSVSSHAIQGRIPLERAPNPVVFIESSKFLAGPDPLWPEQYKVVRDFFELLCPICNNTKRIWGVDDIPRDEQVLFEWDICPGCGLRKSDTIDSLNLYNALIGIAGRRSGKTACIAGMCGSCLHDLLTTEDLHQKYDIIRTQVLDATFAAAAGKQAADTVYGQFRGMYDESPWFQDYRKALMGLEISDRDLRRGDLYWDTDSKIFWKEKHLRVESIPSNAATQTGKTYVFSVIDELSKLDSGDSKRSATEVYRALSYSLRTVRSRVSRLREQGDIATPNGFMFCISSPLYTEDKAMRLLKKTAPNSQKWFSFHQATWDFNPNIEKEDLAEEYADDPVGAERDFGANPPGAENPFIVDTNLVDACVSDQKSIFNLREVFFDRVIEKNGKKIIFRFIKIDVVNFRFNNLTEYVIHCDPGEKGDSFCLGLGHREDGRCVIDGGIEIRPVPKGNKQGLPPRSVHFPSMTDLILGLAEKVTLAAVSYDRWNSTDQIHRLIDANIFAIGKNINRDDHNHFLQSMSNNLVSMPALERDNVDPVIERNVPCAKAVYELKRLNDNGMKVDHPSGGSNDMIQCYIGVHRLLISPDSVLPAKSNVLSGLRQKQVCAGKIIRLRR